MSEENKTVEPAEQNVQATTEVKEEVKEQPKLNSFTQEQLDNIIKQRLEAEKRKHDKQLEEIKTRVSYYVMFMDYQIRLQILLLRIWKNMLLIHMMFHLQQTL